MLSWLWTWKKIFLKKFLYCIKNLFNAKATGEVFTLAGVKLIMRFTSVFNDHIMPFKMCDFEWFLNDKTVRKLLHASLVCLWGKNYLISCSFSKNLSIYECVTAELKPLVVPQQWQDANLWFKCHKLRYHDFSENLSWTTWKRRYGKVGLSEAILNPISGMPRLNICTLGIILWPIVSSCQKLIYLQTLNVEMWRFSKDLII